jgi:hypothetical protein
MKKLTVIVLLLAFSDHAFAQFEHPDLKSGRKQVRSVVLMPIEAVMGKLAVKSDLHWGFEKPRDYLEVESRQVEKDLAPLITELFRSFNCTVNDTALAPSELAKDSALQSTQQELQQQVDALLLHLTYHEDEVRKGKASLGEPVAKLQVARGSDALVFVRAVGQILSGGQRAMNILGGGNSSDSWRIWIMVVDARTGDLLYFAEPQGRNNLAQDTAKARPAIEKSFKNFLKANTSSAEAKKTGS